MCAAMRFREAGAEAGDAGRYGEGVQMGCAGSGNAIREGGRNC